MEKKARVIVAPLDWGLGHATRCIPIIRKLINHDVEVIIAADGRAAHLLKEEFPQLTHIHLSGYHVHYSRWLNIAASIALQVPKITFAVVREYFQLRKIIKKYKPDAVISDNRFGLWNKSLTPSLSKGEGEKEKGVYTIFITHQLMVKCPKPFAFLEPIIHRIMLWFIKRYNECWIPDAAGEENISGDLSHKYPLPSNAKFIGWLSRFYSETLSNNRQDEYKYDLLVLLSGTEPLRTEFEKKLVKQIQNTNYRTLMVRGITEEQKQINHHKNIGMVPYLNSRELLTAITESEVVICRSGYSSLMDLAAMGKKAILVPTPGQTEQEYLAEKLMKKKKYYSSSQKKFNLEEAMKLSDSYNGLSEIKFETAISRTVEMLIKNITEY